MFSADRPTLLAPKSVEAGQSLSITTNASSKAVLYIVGTGDAIRRDVQPGENVVLGPNEIHNAGHYVATLAANSKIDQAEFDVTASTRPASISFIAKPSRLPVDMQGGISGVVYVFDRFHNLIVRPTQVSFQLAGVSAETTTARNGVAWTKINSAQKAGVAQLRASTGGVTETRVVQQVPGNPCNLRMSVRPLGQRVLLETDPVRDCRGNVVPDGTIVTFSETHDGRLDTTVDVPLKQGVARTEIPAYSGAVISVASGVVVGSEIRLRAGK